MANETLLYSPTGNTLDNQESTYIVTHDSGNSFLFVDEEFLLSPHVARVIALKLNEWAAEQEKSREWLRGLRNEGGVSRKC